MSANSVCNNSVINMSLMWCIIILLVIVFNQKVGAKLLDQIFLIESKRDVGVIYFLSINAEQETMTLTMEGPDDVWMGVTFGAEDMFNVSSYIYYLENNEWIFAERYLRGEQDAGDLIEIIDKNNYNVNKINGTATVTFTRSWIGTHPTSFTLYNYDTVFQYGFARGTDGTLSYHGNEGRSHSAYTLQHEEESEYGLIDQTFPIESKRDVGVIYTLSINAEQETMTLTMKGADNIWMSVIFGAEDMFDASSYTYYLENNEWIFAERYLRGEQDAGDLIAIIDANNYNVLNENGNTTLTFSRQWIGTHSTSFNLSNNDTVFQYGFARGIDAILAYHGNDGRSHSSYTLQRTEEAIMTTTTTTTTTTRRPSQETVVVYENEPDLIIGIGIAGLIVGACIVGIAWFYCNYKNKKMGKHVIISNNDNNHQEKHILHDTDGNHHDEITVIGV